MKFCTIIYLCKFSRNLKLFQDHKFIQKNNKTAIALGAVLTLRINLLYMFTWPLVLIFSTKIKL